ncbi:hypothetical protein TWF569_003138 [Orbilia oligospora]|uniref:Uncharacterized protein n=1 Tax=Orbilia oligospora TaxID=2813651 RepID=A0A7C8N7F4_ORBOL|nr:hypothetical protein TWF103_001646 [Orbilia oligospora]KAF3087058.1 hypothetical protein TWF103_001646 [Orbilia oligospora]KAF3097036.1 hypothetical protein TWF102_006475 [Orbilia oligospora]KAF3110198.1 hypothetical protein TWF706_000925 [Orbilia oligospora]KAF3110199.1 hypothetical protein TWF706_000925 [Orbilia oligospora]
MSEYRIPYRTEYVCTVSHHVFYHGKKRETSRLDWGIKSMSGGFSHGTPTASPSALFSMVAADLIVQTSFLTPHDLFATFDTCSNIKHCTRARSRGSFRSHNNDDGGHRGPVRFAAFPL